MCGNSFHPAMVSSALGNNVTLKQWILAPHCDGMPLVADQKLAYEVFSDLADKVQRQASVPIGAPVFNHRFGPLVNARGQTLPLAPLLRVREVLAHGILHASWTLYQPHALVWDYSFWQFRENFGRLAGLLVSIRYNASLAMYCCNLLQLLCTTN